MKAPLEGQGLHDWLLAKSRELLVEGNEPEEVVSLLLNTIDIRTTQNPETEIRNAVDGADAWLKEHPGYRSGKRHHKFKLDPTSYQSQDPFKWRDKRSYYLPVDEELRKQALAANLELDSYGEFDLGVLFAEINFLICCAIDVRRPFIATLRMIYESNRGEHFQFIVPGYCLTVDRGKCDDNMGKPLYQVIEFDGDTKDDQWKLLAWLDSNVRLGMIVDSGHKSLHGWFPVYHLGRREVKSFFRLATRLGADRHLWVASQYVRMPNGMNRKTGNRQPVVYWNQQVMEEHNEIVSNYCCV